MNFLAIDPITYRTSERVFHKCGKQVKGLNMPSIKRLRGGLGRGIQMARSYSISHQKNGSQIAALSIAIMGLLKGKRKKSPSMRILIFETIVLAITRISLLI